MALSLAPALLLGILLAPQPGPADGQVSAAALARRSEFIFLGTVQQLHSSNVSLLPASDATVEVRVEDILLGPETLNGFTGRNITVRLSRPRSVRAQQRTIFFTNGWLYGKSIAVREVGHLDDRDPKAARKEIEATRRQQAEQALRERLAGADLVIVGKVSGTRPADEQNRITPESEHEPNWWEAQIDIESVEKGPAGQKSITIVFPNSIDQMWARSPRFRAGDEGVLLLRADPGPRGRKFPVKGLTALDPLDFQPRDRLDLIRRLLKR